MGEVNIPKAFKSTGDLFLDALSQLEMIYALIGKKKGMAKEIDNCDGKILSKYTINEEVERASLLKANTLQRFNDFFNGISLSSASLKLDVANIKTYAQAEKTSKEKSANKDVTT